MRFVFIIFISVFLLSCSDEKRDNIIFGLDSMPTTFDPRNSIDATSFRVNRLLYSRLIAFDESAKFVPGITSWEMLSPTQYRFTITQHKKFHNGAMVTAADIKATYDSVLDEANKSIHRSSVALIERIEVIDEKSVDFILKYADSLFPSYLIIGIMPAKLINSDHDFDKQPIGSGPFKFKGWDGAESLSIVRRDDNQEFEFIRVVAPEVRVMKLLRGEIDLLQNGLMPELQRYLEKDARVEVHYHSGSDFAYLGFNLEDKDTSNLIVRQAIALGIDRDAILKYIFGGSEKKATAFFPGDHWLGNPTLVPYEYNPQKARALLQEIGYGSENPLTLSYKTSTNPFRLRIATILQRQLAEIGIKVDIQSYDWGTFFGDIKAGRFQMYSLKWVGIKAPDIFEYVFHSEKIPPNGANRGRYKNPQIDALIEESKTLDDLEPRLKIYRQIQKIIFDDLPYVPLWYEGHFYAASKNITGYSLSTDGNYDGLINVQKVK